MKPISGNISSIVFGPEASFAERQDVHSFVENFTENLKQPMQVKPGVIGRNNIYLSESQRTLFKVYDLSSCGLLKKIRAKLRIGDSKFGQRYGRAEWRNANFAFSHRISIPRPIAYFEYNENLRICMQVVVFEYLNDYKTLLDLVGGGRDPMCLVESLVPSLVELVSKGILHADLNCRNLLFSKDSDDIKIIDWEYSCFKEKKQKEMLLFYLGHIYASGISGRLPENLYDEWVDSVLLQNFGYSSDISARHIYNLAKNKRISRVMRYSIFR